MKFTIDKNILLTKLQLLAKAIPTRTTLPIIGSALFTYKKNILNIRATDLEISINLSKVKNLTEIRNILLQKAYDCKLNNYYIVYEHIGKNRKIYRNHCVLTLIFEEQDELLAEFIKYSKTIKNISIESVGLDDISFKLMYASKKYLNMMEKQFVDNYINLKKEKKLYKQDSIIYKVLNKKY